MRHRPSGGSRYRPSRERKTRHLRARSRSRRQARCRPGLPDRLPRSHLRTVGTEAWSEGVGSSAWNCGSGSSSTTDASQATRSIARSGRSRTKSSPSPSSGSFSNNVISSQSRAMKVHAPCTLSLADGVLTHRAPLVPALQAPALDGADLQLRENRRPAGAWLHSRHHPRGRKWCPAPQESSLSCRLWSRRRCPQPTPSRARTANALKRPSVTCASSG